MLFLCDHFDRNEISFRVINCHINTNRNEIVRKETSVHAFISSKEDWLLIGFCWIGRFSRTISKTKFHFISATIKRNVNKISLYGAFKFHLGSISFRVSCKHPLKKSELAAPELLLSKVSTLHYQNEKTWKVWQLATITLSLPWVLPWWINTEQTFINYS